MAAKAEPALAYQPLFTIARGGIGAVTLVVRRDGEFERLYAMKTLHEHYRAEPSVRKMFLAEAKIAGLIRHSNVVAVLDVGESSEGPYLVMDFVEGLSLAQLLRSKPKGAHLPVSLCARIAADVARGLHAAHQLQSLDGTHLRVVHRDVSPQNILLGYDGSVRVTDFGIAKAFGAQEQTATGILKGKLGYMAPEQLRFQKPDLRTDLYALGVVLFESLSGERLFSGGFDSDMPQQILFGPTPDIAEHRRDIPVELEQLLMELLSKEPEHRPTSAHEVAERLCEAVDVHESSLEQYLDEHFATRREHLRTKIGEALKNPPPSVTVAAEEVPSDSAADYDYSPAPAPKGRMRSWLALSMGGAALLGAGLWIGAGSAEPTSEPIEAPPVEARIEPVALPAIPEASEPNVEPEAEVVEAESGAMTAEPERAAPARMRPRMRAMRSGAMRPQGSSAMGMGGQPNGGWGWE
ncbi:MAG: serine/threonine-protein kinase [Myxococcota bacterium]